MGVDGHGQVLAGASDRLGSQQPGQGEAVVLALTGERAWPKGTQGAFYCSLIQHLP